MPAADAGKAGRGEEMSWKDELYEQAERAARSAWDETSFVVAGTPRESTWYAIMLLGRAGGGDLELANRILENLPLGTDAVTHTLVSAGYAYLKFGDGLGAPAKARMRAYIREAVPKANHHHCAFANTNHPVTAWLGVLLAGQVLENDLLGEMGWGHVEDFLWWIDWQHAAERGMGTYPEFNSPTYAVTNIMAASMAADACRPGLLKDKLIDLEGRFWTDLALFWHHPTHLLSGPHSRAYQEGCIGHGASVAFLMYILTEGRSFADFRLNREYDHQCDLCCLGALTDVQFHVPPQARRMLFEKQFPYAVQVNGYCGGWNYGTLVDDPNGSWLGQEGIRYAEMEQKHPGHYMELKSYQTGQYALGTSSLPYREGLQSNCFMLRYRCADPVRKRGDTRSLYTRYLKNEKRQGESNYYEREKRQRNSMSLVDQGRTAVFQHENKAVVLYRPREVENQGCRSLKLNLLMTWFQPFDELLVGAETPGEFPYEFDWRDVVFIRDAGVYVAIRPLEPVDLGRQTACRLAEERDHLVLSIYNYQDERRDFDTEQMFTIHNGFVCEVGHAESFDGFGAFRKHIAEAAVTERRDGALRDVTYTSGDDTLRVVFDAKWEQFRHKSINGRYSYPERIRVTMQGKQDDQLCPTRIW